MTIVGQPLLFCQSVLTFCQFFVLGMHFDFMVIDRYDITETPACQKCFDRHPLAGGGMSLPYHIDR